MSMAQRKRVLKEKEDENRPKDWNKKKVTYEYQNPFDGNPKSIDIYFAQKEGKLPLNEVIDDTESVNSENILKHF